jgi:uncharacterized protein YjbI with pentapeptide repeats
VGSASRRPNAIRTGRAVVGMRFGPGAKHPIHLMRNATKASPHRHDERGDAGELPELWKTVDEAARQTRIPFAALVSTCGYGILSVIQLRDADFFGNEARIKLPVIDLTVGTSGFFMWMPALALFNALYFFVYMSNVWARLHAVRSLQARLRPNATGEAVPFPWIGLMARHAGVRGLLTNIVFSALAWWSVPILFLCIALRCNRFDSNLEVWLSGGPPPALFFWYLYAASLVAITAGQFLVELRLSGGRRAALVVSIATISSIGLFAGGKATAARIGPANLRGVHVSSAEGVPGEVAVGFALNGLDFSGSDLAGASFAAMSLSNSKFRSANLYRATFDSASLQRADFRYASGTHISMKDANLAGANLELANFYRAKMSHANLIGAVLAGADLVGADLNGADLRWTDMRHVRLANADLRNAQLAGADLSDAMLSGALLDKAFFGNVELGDPTTKAWAALGTFGKSGPFRDRALRDAMPANLSRADLVAVTFTVGLGSACGVSVALRAEQRDAKGKTKELLENRSGEAPESGPRQDDDKSSYPDFKPCWPDWEDIRIAQATEINPHAFEPIPLPTSPYVYGRTRRAMLMLGTGRPWTEWDFHDPLGPAFAE